MPAGDAMDGTTQAPSFEAKLSKLRSPCGHNATVCKANLICLTRFTCSSVTVGSHVAKTIVLVDAEIVPVCRACKYETNTQ